MKGNEEGDQDNEAELDELDEIDFQSAIKHLRSAHNSLTQADCLQLVRPANEYVLFMIRVLIAKLMVTSTILKKQKLFLLTYFFNAIP